MKGNFMESLKLLLLAPEDFYRREEVDDTDYMHTFICIPLYAYLYMHTFDDFT